MFLALVMTFGVMPVFALSYSESARFHYSDEQYHIEWEHNTTTPAALSTTMAALDAFVPASLETVTHAKNSGLNRIVNTVARPGFQPVGGEWTVMALARAGHPVPAGYFERYLMDIGDLLDGLAVQADLNPQAVTAPPQMWRALNPGTGRWEVRLSDAQTTENARLIMALTSLGIDASAFVSRRSGNVYDLISPLGIRESATSTRMWGVGQGANGPVWSLIALSSRNWSSPYQISSRGWVVGTTGTNPVTPSEKINWLLSHELNGGGWNLQGTGDLVDPDLTAMALQALAPYRTHSGVNTTIDRALARLSQTQLSNGSWGSWGNDNVQSPAQVIIALTALGICPQTDPRFTKADGNPVTAVLGFQDAATGGFFHPRGGSVNLMATEQAAHALVAYWRFRTGRNHLYNMSDAPSLGDWITPQAADKTELRVLLAMANGLIPADFISWNLIADERTRAVSTYNDQNATQPQVDEAVRSLRAVIDSAVLSPLGLARLDLIYQIERAQGLNISNYTAGSWGVKQSALAAANSARNVPVQQFVGQITTATANLRSAIDNLVSLAEINAAITYAEGRVEANYTGGSWRYMQLALAAARNILSNPNATWAQVEGAVISLQNAVAALEVSFPYIILSPTGTYTFIGATLGYTALTPRTITVSNMGTRVTSTLNIELTGANQSSFTLNTSSVAGIAPGGSASFTIVPNAGLAVGTYEATVVVSGINMAARSVNVRFTVNPPNVSSISLAPSGTHIFPAVIEGYGQQGAHTVTVISTGSLPTGSLSVTLSGANPNSFVISTAELAGIAAGESASFTVTPHIGLAAGTHTAVVTVSGVGVEPQWFDVSFTVNPAPVFGINIMPGGNFTFLQAEIGYAHQRSHIITIRNTGNQPTGTLAVTLLGPDADSFSLSNTTILNIMPGSTANFSVVPNTGLPVGTHRATVNVFGANVAEQSFDVIFVVTSASVSRVLLNTAIAAAEGLRQADHTAASWLALQTALSAARSARDNANATQTLVDTAADNLFAAIEGLEEIRSRVFLNVADPNARAGQTREYFRGYINIGPGETAYSILRRPETGLNVRSSGHATWAGSYVGAINGFGEFDDGPLSGWMYRVNGVFPTISASLYNLSDGDRVEWLFTRNLGLDLGVGVLGSIDKTALNIEISRAEAHSEADYTTASWAILQTALAEARQLRDGAGATQVQVNVATNNLRTAINTLVRVTEEENVELTVEAAEEDGTAVAAIEPDIIRRLVAQAINEGVAGITINVANEENANHIEAVLTVELINYIAQNGLALTVRSVVATLTFDTETLAGIGHGQPGDTVVSIIAEHLADTSALNIAPQEAVANGTVIRLAVTAGGYTVRNFNGVAMVRIPYAPPYNMPEDDYDLLTAYHLDTGGVIREISGARYAGSYVIFTTRHFSLFFVSEWVNPFVDVARGAWYLRDVRFVYSGGIAGGTAPGQFSPGTNLSRAMMVTMLWRLEGQPIVEEGVAFTDVQPDSWYANAINWASANDIIRGYGDGQFGPGDNITREQLAVIFQNFAAHKGHSTTYGHFVTDFADAQNISEWAHNAMMWANAKGIITGRTRTTLAPEGTATRAESAAILRRFVETT